METEIKFWQRLYHVYTLFLTNTLRFMFMQQGAHQFEQGYTEWVCPNFMNKWKLISMYLGNLKSIGNVLRRISLIKHLWYQ